MKSFRFFTVVFFFILHLPLAYAEHEPYTSTNDTGIGISIGSREGLSLYYRLDNSNFTQGLLSSAGSGNFYLTADYCSSHLNLIEDAEQIVFYYGAGVAGGSLRKKKLDWYSKDDKGSVSLLGGRIPLGIQFFIPQTPLQINFELGPTLYLAPETHAVLDLLFTIRYLW
ncbi:MAG: hypothetical protein HQK54_07555 [Oligoflexales bacterium]|nr:hypothetical protein [Oligoflexales bacterium]